MCAVLCYREPTQTARSPFNCSNTSYMNDSSHDSYEGITSKEGERKFQASASSRRVQLNVLRHATAKLFISSAFSDKTRKNKINKNIYLIVCFITAILLQNIFPYGSYCYFLVVFPAF